MKIDLHLHSSASDGALAPDELVRAAIAAGLDVIALTDHDTAAGVARAWEAGGDRIVVIPGIELSSTHAGAELHFLGYFIEPSHPQLWAFARRAAARRRERMLGMIRRLGQLGVPVEFEDVVAASAGAESLGRPHLARALVQRKRVQSFNEAFERFLADGGPAYLPIELLTPREAIDLIHALGGLAAWAHPPVETARRELRSLASWGLDGVECFRPRNSSQDTQWLVESAGDLDLFLTGGSDWHGSWGGALGDFFVTRAQVGRLLEAGGL